MRFGSLFSGIGGLDLGLERSGMTCAWQVEIDDYATRVLEKHWPNVPRFRDVRCCGAHNLPAVDLIAGGFPCQDVSLAGARAGITGARSGLWKEYARIIRELRPRFVLVENVPGLLSGGMGEVLGDLASLGFDAEWSVLSACSMGAPHTRERVFIVANNNKERRFWESLHIDRKHEVRDGLNAWEASPSGEWGDVERWFRSIVEDGNGISPASERDGVGNGIPYRLDRIGATGNAVVPQVAEWLGRRILEFSRMG